MFTFSEDALLKNEQPKGVVIPSKQYFQGVMREEFALC